MRGLAVELAILVGAFLGATLLAEALGAENTGTAISFGAIAFALAVVAVIVRRP